MAEAIPTAMFILALIAAGALAANRVGISAPVMQTVIGIVLGFIPGVPHLDLEPRFVLLCILPPLIYAGAVELPWEEFRDNLRPISALAFGLVGATIASVATLAHFFIPGMSWPAAVVLGAVVSPTDPVAASAVAARLGVPRHLVAIVEGEGLINDTAALTTYRLALVALLAGSFSLGGGILRLAAILIGETLYGCAVGWLTARLRARIIDARAEITVSLLTPFMAYLVPEMLGGSGVLATVAAGMYISEQAPEIIPSGTRLHLAGVWDMITFVLNGGLFILTGLQMRSVWYGTPAFAPGQLALYAGVVAAGVIATRFAWVWPTAWLARRFSGGTPRSEDIVRPSHLTFVSWSGMRGGISLAAALSIPLAVQSRTLILFLTAAVICATLLLQGITLPYVIRALHLDRQASREREAEQRQELKARLECLRAALQILKHDDAPGLQPIRAEYEQRVNRLAQITSDRDVDRHRADFERETKTLQAAIDAQRRCILDLHRREKISEEVMRRVERELDLHESILAGRFDSNG